MQLWQPTRGILQPGQHWRRGQGAVAAGGTTTWNPSDKTTPIVLSNGDLTATNPSSSGTQNVRSIATASTNKLYCEFTMVTRNSPNGETMALGVMSLSQSIGLYLGGSAGSVGLWPRSASSTSSIYFNGGGTNLGTFADGAVHGTVWAMATDFSQTPPKIWWKDVTHGSGWNNGVIGSQDPASNLGGFSNASMSGSPYAICLGMESAVNDATTLNVGATAYAGTPPSGYGNWP